MTFAVLELPARGQEERKPLQTPDGLDLDAHLNRELERVSRSDLEAFSRFYQATNALAFGYVLRILRDRHAAEEVTLDCFTQIWRQARKFDGRRGNARAWLVTIAKSRALDRLRSLKRERLQVEGFHADFDPASRVDAEAEALVSERRRLVERALRSLNPGERDAIELACFEGMTHREVAQALGEPLGTVKSRIRLGMVKLQRQLRTPRA
jgi:RNA polymerase sigma-70 factor (ECF subfamily)